MPQQNIFYYDLARAEEGAGATQVAIDSYKKSLASGWGFFDGYLGLGELYARLGKWQEAAESINHALGLKPDDPRSNLLYALVLEKQGKSQESEKYKQKARDFVQTFGTEELKQHADKLVQPPPQVVEPKPADNAEEQEPKDLELP